MVAIADVSFSAANTKEPMVSASLSDWLVGWLVGCSQNGSGNFGKIHFTEVDKFSGDKRANLFVAIVYS